MYLTSTTLVPWIQNVIHMDERPGNSETHKNIQFPSFIRIFVRPIHSEIAFASFSMMCVAGERVRGGRQRRERARAVRRRVPAGARLHAQHHAHGRGARRRAPAHRARRRAAQAGGPHLALLRLHAAGSILV